MKKIRILVLLIFIIGIFNVLVFSDDKELFMGINSTADILKPNVVFLLDSSGSMKQIIWYPQNGVPGLNGKDGISGTSDDGYDQNVSYSGKLDTWSGGDLTASRAFGLFKRSNLAANKNRWKSFVQKTRSSDLLEIDITGAHSFSENDEYWIRVEWANNGDFQVGYWIFDEYEGLVNGDYDKVVRGRIVERKKFDSDEECWVRLEDIDGGDFPTTTFQVGVDNITPFFWSGVAAVDNSNHRVKSQSYGKAVFKVGWWVIDSITGAIGKIKEKDNGGDRWLLLEEQEGEFAVGSTLWAAGFGEDPIPRDEIVKFKLYGTTDKQGKVEIDANYYKWLVFHTTKAQRDAVSYFTDNGTFDKTILPADAPAAQDNSCGQVDASSNPLKKWVWTRAQVLREVACQVAENSYEKVKMGMFKFWGSQGADWLSDVEDLENKLVPTDLTKLQAYKDDAYGITPGGFTPLAEAMGDIWRYYKPGATDYKNDLWKGKDYQIVDSVFDVATSPIEHWCQKNYLIVMTDGDPTKDPFDEARWSGSIFNNPLWPVQRTDEYDGWSSWDATQGWGDVDANDPGSSNFKYDGTDYMDDVAYFLRHQDLFPDALYGEDWANDQNIVTFTIGFAIDKPLLEQTAYNGDGTYHTASNFNDLMKAFDDIITTILLRNFAFSTITAPKKTTTVATGDVNVSYVGYFFPSNSQSVWEGHLLSYNLIDKYGWDKDDDGDIDDDDGYYTDKNDCESDAATGGKTCTRFLYLSNAWNWDAAQKMENRTTDRNLWYYNGTDNGNGSFSDEVKVIDSLSDEDESSVLTPLFGELTTEAEAISIENNLMEKRFADVFHADVTYLGNALAGKKYLKNINPIESITDTTLTYNKFWDDHQTREARLYVGTNDGILHSITANPDSAIGGQEVWGFVPDEVMPAVKRIANSTDHEYTVDGRLKIEDIFYRKGTVKEWKTVLCFGLRRGGNAFYMMDVTEPTSTPNLLWKFKDSVYSGQSFSKPKIVQMRIAKEGDITNIEDKWVAIFTGGFAFNDEDINDSKGKSIFVVDASTGELLWMIGYNRTGLTDDPGTPFIEASNSVEYEKHLTSSELMNYSIPTAITAIDKNNDGFTDTIYFGNKGGHLFKIDTSASDREDWRTYNLYQQDISTIQTATIDNGGVDATLPYLPKITVNTPIPESYEGYNVIAIGGSGATATYAAGKIEQILPGNVIQIKRTSENQFQDQQEIFIKAWDPIYLAPTVAFDACYKMWVTFGTGDRDRPKTNPNSGKLVAMLDSSANYNTTNSNLQNLSSGGTASTITEDGKEWDVLENTTSSAGFYYEFPDAREKLFDPEPIILPDSFFVPHIIFNTYQPPSTSGSTAAGPCDASEGNMKFYDIAIDGCGTAEYEIKLKRTGGRISGGGMLGGGEYVMYRGTDSVASVPPLEMVKPTTLGYPGSVIFWKEKKR